MSPIQIRSIPVLNDNYVHLIHDPAHDVTVCVDPADDPTIAATVKTWGWTITHILVTHPHYDHVDGIAPLVDAFKCEVYGNRADFDRIPKCGHGVQDGQVLNIGAITFKIIAVPGHVPHHIAYYIEREHALFSGDTLFSLGCGRLLGGTAVQLWSSLKKIRALPKQTKIYFSHEYTQANARFALTVDGDNEDLKARAHEVEHMRARGEPTVPVTLAQEISCNPFLRCDVESFKNALGMTGRDDEQVFAELRRQKDNF
ncbi:MAG: hydroxyacylglutathione hydrolase [Magnetovibrio sp.]|nr:hydroxyacylglutathione hydrolase [Magnetovibrio sp.]